MLRLLLANLFLVISVESMAFELPQKLLCNKDDGSSLRVISEYQNNGPIVLISLDTRSYLFTSDQINLIINQNYAQITTKNNKFIINISSLDDQLFNAELLDNNKIINFECVEYH